MTTTTTIKAGDLPKTIQLPEGQSLTLSGSVGATGVAYLLDPVLGGTNSLKSWAIGSGAIPAIGGFAGTQQILITCGAGSISAEVGDAVLGSAILSLDPITCVAKARSAAGAIFNIVGNRMTSIKYVGDSLGENKFSHPMAPSGVALEAVSPAMTNINSNGLIVRRVLLNASCPAGAGTMRFYAADKTMTWQAFGDTEGARVAVTSGCFAILPSGSPNAEAFVKLLPLSGYPTIDKSDTVTRSSSAGAIVRAMINNYNGAWEIFRGYPVPRVRNYCISGAKAADFLLNTFEWAGDYTDVTVFNLGSNATGTVAGADLEYTAIVSVLSACLATGSIPVVMLPFLSNALTVQNYRSKVHLVRKLKQYCTQNGIRMIDGAPYVYNQGAINGGGRPLAFIASSNDHTSGCGGYILAKYAVDRTLDPLVQKIPPLIHTALYDATDCPDGNMYGNGVAETTIAVNSLPGLTGTKPSLWTISGTTTLFTCVSKGPGDASPVPRTDGKPGNWWEMVVVNGEATDKVLGLALTNYITAGYYAAGDNLVVSADLQLLGSHPTPDSAAIGGLDYKLAVTGGTPAQSFAIQCDGSTNMGTLYGETLTTHVESLPLTIVTGMTNTLVTCNLTVKPGATVTLRLDCHNIRKVLS